jgi:hypothetical protein
VSALTGLSPRQKPACDRRLRQLAVKKDGVILVNKPHQLKMFLQFYQTHLQQQLKNTEYLTLKILVYLLQSQKQVSLELLAFSPQAPRHTCTQVGVGWIGGLL